ncbi:MAG: hypothetical protein KA712_03730 [Myxococcales bacterium]|nr:hypothetical protein [Myxococcales bacterium]
MKRGGKTSFLGFLALLGLGLVVMLLAPRAAQAYPQWQFSAGATRCNQCHYAPTGGGLINGYGRDAIGEELSTWQGDGAFLHGAADLPRVLKLGLDLRFAMLSNDNGGPDQPKNAFFPMQLDAHVRLEAGAFAFQGIVGGRAQVRSADAPVPQSNFQPESGSRLVSREHWAIWQPAARGMYVRAGRFFAPFGLRLAEHLVYVRRDLGFNILEETYNVSAGFLDNGWEAHLTLFAPDFLQNGSQETGVAAYAERRVLNELASVAVQGRFASREGAQRGIGGVVLKGYIEPARLLVMGEGNYIQNMPEGVDAVGQFAGLLGASWLPPLRGFLVTLWGERLQTDLATQNTALNALTGLVSWFPYPHFELQLVARHQAADGARAMTTLLAQLHYFL